MSFSRSWVRISYPELSLFLKKRHTELVLHCRCQKHSFQAGVQPIHRTQHGDFLLSSWFVVKIHRYTKRSFNGLTAYETTGLKKWVEIGNSGMFRPEMLRPMGFPDDVHVIAWGLSLERPTMIKYGIDDIRTLLGEHVVCLTKYPHAHPH